MHSANFFSDPKGGNRGRKGTGLNIKPSIFTHQSDPIRPEKGTRLQLRRFSSYAAILYNVLPSELIPNYSGSEE
jgi:hypothetical protein